MEAEAVLSLRPALTRYLAEFKPCMGKVNNIDHLATYIRGQLGPTERKSVEPMALAAGVPVRTLQEFLSQFKWDHKRMRDLHQRRVVREHAHPVAIGMFDETSFIKKGTRTACVQRQYCGAAGKVENCVVSVHLGYATPTFHTLLDGELYLPEESWHNDRERCRAAGIPDDVVYRPKTRIALDQLAHARSNGVRLAWLTYDEGYGKDPSFLRELDRMGQKHAGEVPANFRVWTREPRVRARTHPCDTQRLRRGGSNDGVRRSPRPLMVQTNPMAEVRNILAHSPILRRQPWELYRVMDSSRGPLLWEAKRMMVWLKDERELPTRPHHLVIARSIGTDRADLKFFISNAPEQTGVQDILFVGMSRWRVERLFEDSKMEIGMDHFEVRKHVAVARHLILSCLSHAFLAEFCERWRHKRLPRTHDQPDRRRGAATHAAVVHRPPLLTHAG